MDTKKRLLCFQYFVVGISIFNCVAEESKTLFEYEYHAPQSLTFNKEYSASIGNISITNVGKEDAKFRYDVHAPKAYLYDKVTKICHFTNHLVLLHSKFEEAISVFFNFLNLHRHYYLLSGKQTRVFKAYIDLNKDINFDKGVSFINKNYKNIEYHFFNPKELITFNEEGCSLRKPDFKILNIQLSN